MSDIQSTLNGATIFAGLLLSVVIVIAAIRTHRPDPHAGARAALIAAAILLPVAALTFRTPGVWGAAALVAVSYGCTYAVLRALGRT